MSFITQLAYREQEQHLAALALRETFNSLVAIAPSELEVTTFKNEPFARTLSFRLRAGGTDAAYTIRLTHERAEIERAGVDAGPSIVDLRGKGGEPACVAILAEIGFRDPAFAAWMRRATNLDAKILELSNPISRRHPMQQQQHPRKPSLA